MKNNSRSPLHEVWDNGGVMSKKGEVLLSKNTVKNLIGKAIAVGPFYYFAVNFCNYPNILIEQKSPTLYEFYKVSESEVDFDFLINRIHPDDVAFVQKAEEFLNTAINKVYYKDIKNVKSSYSYRVKDGNGDYRLILHQGIVIKEDEHGKVAYSLLIHTDIGHITDRNPRTISLFGFDGMPSFLKVDPFEEFSFEEKNNLYTPRETEVLRLTGSGYSNKDVAEALFVSEETVKSHKKNILAKSDCKNITEVVTTCVRQGLI